jgi:UDP-N-acetylglucosamine:LPS N-acetylglucosamine transferase
MSSIRKYGAVVGNPLRRELIKASLEAPPLKEACLLIIGGSQGSKR